MAVCVCVCKCQTVGTAARTVVPQLRGQRQVSHLSNLRVNAANTRKRSSTGVRGRDGEMVKEVWREDD